VKLVISYSVHKVARTFADLGEVLKAATRLKGKKKR
jgi:hypothetical protein